MTDSITAQNWSEPYRHPTVKLPHEGIPGALIALGALLAAIALFLVLQ